MKIKIFLSISLILNMLFLIVFFYFFVFGKKSFKLDVDGRYPVKLTPEERNHILKEMRFLLKVINQINGALSQNNFEEIAKLAESCGMKMVGKAEEETTIMLKLPLPMKRLGLGTHQHCDEIAEKIRNGRIKEFAQIHQEIKILTDKCVACHDSYKIILE